MGLSHEQHAELIKNLKPPVTETPATRFDPEVEDATIGNEERLRGIPAVGRVTGTMKGTRPGIDTVAELERAARELNEAGRAAVHAKMKAAREALRHPQKR